MATITSLLFYLPTESTTMSWAGTTVTATIVGRMGLLLNLDLDETMHWKANIRMYPNTDTYSGGNIQTTGIRIYDISEPSDVMTFRVYFPGSPTEAATPSPTASPTTEAPTDAPTFSPTTTPTCSYIHSASYVITNRF